MSKRIKLIQYIRSTWSTPREQRRQLDLLMQLNQRHLEQRQKEAALEARIQSFEMAYRMQSDASDAFDTRLAAMSTTSSIGRSLGPPSFRNPATTMPLSAS